jgi:tripartite ATP-independent transporter DctM subunit
MLAGMYMIYVIIRCLINPSLAPPLPPEQLNVPYANIAYELLTAFVPLALLILSVLGAIMFGLATPSEAAAIGALGALVLAAAYRSLSFDKLKESVYLTAKTSAMVGWLFVGSFTFSAVFAILGGDAVIKDFVVGLDLSPFMFLLVTQIIIFILGWPLEWTEIIVIFVPIFLPLLDHFGIDPLFFGLLIALNIQTSFLSPPVAMAPFYLKGVAPKHVNINDIFSGVMPFIFIVLLAMTLLYIFPGIGMWLPSYLYGR